MLYQLKFYYTSRNTGTTLKPNWKNSRTNQVTKETPSKTRNLRWLSKVAKKISTSVSGWTFRLNQNKVTRRFISNRSPPEYLDQMLLLILSLDASGLLSISYPDQRTQRKLTSSVLVESLTLECLHIHRFRYPVSNGWWDRFSLLKIAWCVLNIQILKHQSLIQ
jgi:hypothetical protein